MKFGHVEMDEHDTPIVWDALSKDEFDFVMRAKNVYEQCLRYSGRDVHEVNCVAGNILNSTYNFCLVSLKMLLNQIIWMTSMNHIKMKVVGKHIVEK